MANLSTFADAKERPSEVRLFPISQTWDVWYWYRVSHLPTGSVLRVEWYRPDGTLDRFYTQTAASIGRYNFHSWLLPRSGWGAFPGDWEVALVIDGVELDRQAFTVTTGVGEPEIRVTQGTTYILDGRTTPIDFGSVALGGTPPTRTFTIANQGAATLDVSNPILPPGFSLVGGFPTSIAAGSTATFTLQLNTNAVGSRFGQMEFTTNDADESLFRFTVEGTVTGTPVAGSPVLTVPRPALAYPVGSSAVVVTADATVTDSDSPNFNGGSLTVAMASGGTPDDLLSILDVGNGPGQVGFTGGVVSYEGTPLGLVSGGAGGAPLVVALNANANVTSVQAVLRAITFATTTELAATAPRALRFVLVDETGKSSNHALKTIVSHRTPPTISSIADQTTLEDASTPALNFTVGDQETPAANLVVEAHSSDQSLVPDGNIVLGGAGAARTVTITPAPDRSGFVTITLTVRDANQSTASTSFLLEVLPVNDAPEFLAGSDVTVLEDAGAVQFPGWATSIVAGPADEAGQTLTFQVTNNNNGLFSTQPAIAANGQLTFTPALNANGSALVTVILRDNGGTTNGGIDFSAPQTFTITVTPVNDPPSFVKGADVTILEDAGPQTILAWATSISSGPPDEVGQTLTFQTGNSNSALFSVPPAVDALGNLTFTPAANANGTATVVVILRDNGGVANGGNDTSVQEQFTITVTPVNDAPTFVKGSDVTAGEGTGPRTLLGWASDLSAGPPDESGQELSFELSNDDNSLFLVQPAIDPLGNLTFTPAVGVLGTATVTVVLRDDGGTDDGGSDASVPQTFTITLVWANDPPSFTVGPNVTVLEDSGPALLTGWATDISPGPAEEADQNLTFMLTSNNPTLFLVQPALDAQGNLSFRPAANANGSATITVLLKDDGGTDNGGSDTSPAQTFTITVTPVNDPPSFVKGANITLAEDSGPQTRSAWASSISAGPANESSQTVAFTLVSDNPGLFLEQPALDILGNLTFTPADDAVGTTTITVTLQDNGGTDNGGIDTSLPQTFTITITPINDPPSFVKGADITVLEDAGLQTILAWATSLSVGPPNEVGQTLTFQTSNNNNALFSVAPAIDPSGNLTFTPAANANGTALVTVVLRDSGGSANSGIDFSPPQTFTITVTPVNDAPIFVKGPDVTAPEGSGPQTRNGWATGISAGPLNESGQVLTFTLVSDNPDLFLVQPALDALGNLTFTPVADLAGTTTVTVTLQDNGGTDNDGIDTSAPQTFTITLTPVNDPPSFVKGADVTVLEDAGPQTIAGWASDITAGPPDEAGQTLTFELTSDNDALFSVPPAIDAAGNLTFTLAPDANGVAIVTVVLRDDGGVVDGGSDASEPQTFTITITPVNDAPTFVMGPDVIAGEGTGPQTLEGWASDVLAGPPDEADQSLLFEVTNDNNALFLVQPVIDPLGNLTFTPAVNAIGTATVTVVLRDDGGTDDGGSDASVPQTFTITLVWANDPPSFTVGPNVTVLEDSGPTLLAGWATDLSPGPIEEAGQSLTFTLTSDNPTLFLVQPALDAQGNLTFTPAHDAVGTTTITVLLKDNGGTDNGGIDTSAPQTFTITLTPVNDPPSFAKGTDVIVLEDAGPQTIAGWASGITTGPLDEAGQTLTFELTSDNDALFSVPPSIDAAGNLTFTLAPDANGVAIVTVVLRDDGGVVDGGSDASEPQTFTITITPVNDAPSFVKGPDITVPEDAAAQTRTNWASALLAGPSDEAGQNLTFHLTNDNHALFSVQPALDPLGNLTFTPATNAVGTAVVTVTLQDDGGTDNGGSDTSAPQTFTITLTPVNDPPSFVKGVDVTALEDSGPQLRAGWATSISAGPPDESGQALTFTLVSDNPSLFLVQPALDALGNLTFTPAVNAVGSTTVSVVLRDNGGVADGGNDTSPAQTFTITLTPVNDPPTFVKGPDVTVLEDAGPQTVLGWASGMSAGPPDEAGQTMVFQTSNTNPSLFTVQPTLDEFGNLTFTPAPDANGVATVLVTLRDNGGVANGGNDASLPQSFTLTIFPVNDAPRFSVGSDLTIDEDAGTQTLPFWATDIAAGPEDEAAQRMQFEVMVAATTGNLTFAALPTVDSITGTLTFRTALDTNGTATIRLRLIDDGPTGSPHENVSAWQTFHLTVNPIDDAPTFALSGAPQSDEDAGPQSFSGFAVQFVPGPPTATDEANQTLTNYIVTVLNLSGTLQFTELPAISLDGTLTYTSAPNTYGTALVSVRVVDSGRDDPPHANTSVVRQFQIQVLEVNDNPEANPDFYQVAEGMPLTGNVLDNDTDIEGDELTATLLTAGVGSVVVWPDGRFEYRPPAGFTGVDVFTYRVTDGRNGEAVGQVTLTVTPGFISRAYLDLTGDLIPPGTLRSYADQEVSGVPRAQIVQQILGTPAYRLNLVRVLFRRLTGEDLSNGGTRRGAVRRQVLLARLLAAAEESTAAVLRIILTSPEYLRANGGGGVRLARALYSDALGQGLSGPQARRLARRLAMPQARARFIRNLFTRVELYERIVEEHYLRLLRRSPSAQELQTGTTLLAAGGSGERALLIRLLTSVDYHRD